MKIIFDLSVCIIVFCIIALVFFALAPVHVKTKSLRAIWLILIISLAIFAFYSEPSPSDDLYRHYDFVQQMQQGKMSINDNVLLGFMLLCWLAAKLGNPGWLPLISTILFGLFVNGIVGCYVKENKLSRKSVILFYFCVFSYVGVFPLISGIRNALISAMVMYAYIKYYKTNKFKYYLICLTACTVHVVGVFLIIMIFLYHRFIECKWKTKEIIFMISSVAVLRIFISTGLISSFAGMLPGDYGALLSSKIDGYLSFVGTRFYGIRLFFLVLSYLILIICLLYAMYKKYKNNMLIYFFTFVALGAGMEMITDRLIMCMGLLSLPIIDTLISKNYRMKQWIFTIMLLMGFGMIIFFSSYSMFSHIQFNGHNYRIFFARLLGK